MINKEIKTGMILNEKSKIIIDKLDTPIAKSIRVELMVEESSPGKKSVKFKISV